jgi:hypothetical protein
MRPTRRGFGTRVMEGMIQQLKGDLRFDWRAKSSAGATSSIILTIN